MGGVKRKHAVIIVKMDLEGCLVGGRYEVRRRLQSGYFGVTWLAEDRTVGVEVCLKVCQVLCSNLLCGLSVDFLTVCVSVFSLKVLSLSKISFLCAQDFLGGVLWEG